MRYHVVLKDDGNEDRRWTFDSWQEAEIEARFISRQHDDWVPDRYPGRGSRVGEVAVFLDRRVLDRRAPWRELAILRAIQQRPASLKRTAPARCKSADRARPLHRRRAALTALRLARANRRTQSGLHARG